MRIVRFAGLTGGALLALCLPAMASDSVPATLEEMRNIAIPAVPRAVWSRGLQTEAVGGAQVKAPENVPRLWFVELMSPPKADGTRDSVVQAEHAAFRREAARAGAVYEERRSFGDLFNGFTVAARFSDLVKLQRLAGVKAVYPVRALKLDASADLFTALGMTGANIAQSQLGYTGLGVKVAVMDTGIDYDNPDLGGCFGKGCRVTKGYDFVGDAYDADTNPIPVPDKNPDDCAGHGTHVAGIIGANGIVRGVAPEAELRAYRVFGCNGSTSDDVMLAAMERIRHDGNKVLNMSIGSAFDWPGAPTSVGADKLVLGGMVVVASIGNSGDSGLFSAGAPGVAKNVIGVASVENTNITQPAFTIGSTSYGFNPATGAPIPPTSGSFTMSVTGQSASVTGDACTATGALPSLTGTIVLIKRGSCGFNEKSANAQAAGAVGVVLYNNTSGQIFPTVATGTPITIPVVAITQADGGAINTLITGAGATLVWGSATVSSANPSGFLISSFSSYGPPPDLSLKPNLSAPGGNIWSTFPLELGGHASLSGTSMSSPHTAGAAALLLQAFPRLSPAAVKGLLQNTAAPQLWSGNPGFGFLDIVHRQGAGLIQIDKAILDRTTITPSEVAFGEFETPGDTKSAAFSIKNKGEAQTYDVSFEEAIDTYKTRAPSFTIGCVDTGFDQSTITVPRNGTVVVNGEFQDLGCGSNTIWGGYVTFTARLKPGDPGPAQVLHVPVMGYSGDYQAIVAITPTANAFPWIATFNGASFTKVVGSGSFSLIDALNIPYLVVHIEHQVSRLTLTATTLGKASAVIDDVLLPRNSSSTGFFAFAWDGTTTKGKVLKNGTYDMQLCALKALGNPAVPSDSECFTLPQVVLARP